MSATLIYRIVRLQVDENSYTILITIIRLDNKPVLTQVHCDLIDLSRCWLVQVLAKPATRSLRGKACRVGRHPTLSMNPVLLLWSLSLKKLRELFLIFAELSES